MGLREAFQELPDDAFSQATIRDAQLHEARKEETGADGVELNFEDLVVGFEALSRDFPAIADYIRFLQEEGGVAMGFSPEKAHLISYGAGLLGLMIKKVSDEQILDQAEPE